MMSEDRSERQGNDEDESARLREERHETRPPVSPYLMRPLRALEQVIAQRHPKRDR